MRNHWVQKKGSQKYCKFPFKCNGRCTFEDCPITFDVFVASFDCNNPPQQLEVLLKFNSIEVKHRRDERKARQIRGPNRELLKKELKHTTPSAWYNKKFSSLSHDKLKSGKRDEVSSSLHVIQKISSEANETVCSIHLPPNMNYALLTGYTPHTKPPTYSKASCMLVSSCLPF